MSIVLIDGDVLVYACGFASDAGARANGQEHEDLSFCLNGVNKTIESLVKTCEADDYVVFLSHHENFRCEIFPEYKLNRDASHKPYWYKEVKEHLLKRHDAIVSSPGDEADDALGIAQCSGMYGDTVIASVDKDLDMIPGWHYNFSKNNKAKGLYHVSEDQALRIFYKQMLKGDSVDNIPGLYRKRGIRCKQAILDGIDTLTTEREMYEYVLNLYEEDEEFVTLIGKLLWIKREEGEWQPPT